MFLPLSLYPILKGQKYLSNQSIPLTLDYFFPIHNVLQQYPFNDIPNCFYINSIYKDKIVLTSDFSLNFMQNVNESNFCYLITEKSIQDIYEKLIRKDSVFQITIDDIPVRSKIGKTSDNNITYIFTKYSFLFEYRDSRIINIDVFADFPVPLSPDTYIIFSYSVEWKHKAAKLTERNTKMLDKSFFYSENRRRGFINSCLTSVFFILLANYTITKLMNQNPRKTKEDVKSLILLTNEKGNKISNNDLYRMPTNPLLLFNIISLGVQALYIIVLYVILCFLSFIPLFEYIFKYMRYVLYYLSFTVYSFNVSHSMKKYYEKPQKIICITQLIIFICYVSFSTINLSIMKHFSFNFRILFYFIVSIPFTYIGFYIEKASNKTRNSITQTEIFERKIPSQPFYMRIPILSFLVGISIYSSIGLEIHYLYSSVWSVKTYITWGFLIFQILLLVINITCISVFLIHLLLLNENYKWQWYSFLCPSFTGLFVFIQCMLYYKNRIVKTDWTQMIFFYEFSFFLSLIISIVCGTIGYFSSKMFITYTFRINKNE